MTSLGALTKLNLLYISARFAYKNQEYVCPDCLKDVILRKGNIRIHHFAHKNEKDDNCNYYLNPNETQIHKDAKLIFKKLIDDKYNIIIERDCLKNHKLNISLLLDNNYRVELEHTFNYNGIKKADIALFNNDLISYIIEICHTHKTSNLDRPEPWFEINAKHLIDTFNSLDINDKSIKLRATNPILCHDCLIGLYDYKCEYCKKILSNTIVDFHIDPANYEHFNKYFVSNNNNIYSHKICKNIDQQFKTFKNPFCPICYNKLKDAIYNDSELFILSVDELFNKLYISSKNKLFHKNCYNLLFA